MRQKLRKITIIGAGPAGASAAFFLAKAGIPVQILDKAVFPRDKICGDGVSSRAFYTLFRMGIRGIEEFDRGQRIDDVILFDWFGQKRKLEAARNMFGNGFSTIPRETLDARVLEKAREAGAVLREGISIREIRRNSQGFTLVHSEGQEDCEILVGADGIHSRVRHLIFGSHFQETEKSFAMRAYIRNVRLNHPESYYFIYLREIFPGYGWIFPLPGGRANIGFGIPADKLKKEKHNPFDLWDLFLEHPILREELTGGVWESEPKGHHIPMKTDKRFLYKEGAFLCGDAAGLVDPITGDGIDFALESGQLVAEDILEFLHSSAQNQLGEYYKKSCENRIRKRMEDQDSMKKILFHTFLFDRFFRMAKDEPKNTILSRLLLGIADWKEWLRFFFV